MPATGAKRGNLVYHWKHGYIPLDHYAALQKAHHSKTGAVKEMEKRGIPVPKGYQSDHKAAPEPSHITLYHGTHARHVEGIKKDGLKQAMTGTAQSYTLTTSKKQAEGYAAGHGKDAAVVEFHVPKSEVRKIGVNNDAALWNTTTQHNVYGETGTAYALRRTLPAKYVAKVHGSDAPSPTTPTHSAGMDPHAIRATQLREAAAKKRAEADRIAGSVGAPDRAGAMLRAKDSARMNARMDSGLRRFTEKQREASALESKAHLAEGRSKTAAEKQAAADLAVTPSKLSPGDLIQHKGSAHMVTKVNKTTVSVPSIVGGPWEDKLPIAGISKHVPISQLKDSNLQAMYAKAANHPKLRATYAAEMKRRGLLTGN